MEMSRRTFLRAASATGAGIVLATYMHGENEYNAYSREAPMADRDDLMLANGIVVFTGSSGRIEEALRICQPYQKLHVSGCDPVVKNIDALLRAFPVKNSQAQRDYISMDYAKSTAENGAKTRQWLAENPEINRLIVVTSDFHVPRAYSLVKSALADFERPVNFTLHAVHSAPDMGQAFKERVKLAKESAQNFWHELRGPGPR